VQFVAKFLVMGRKSKVKDLEYFREWHENPKAYVNKVFYEYVHEWIKYIKAHADEFNYLEDDDWKEIRERLLDELYRREDLKDMFFEIDADIQATGEDDYAARLELQKEMLEFMKENQFEFDFKDKHIAEMEKGIAGMEKDIEEAIRIEEELQIIEERLKRQKREYQQSLANLDDSMVEHYQRTGKRPVLTSLLFKKRFKGN
jgi:hypothetical protein